MFGLTDKVQPYLDIIRTMNPCKDGVKWINQFGDITCQDFFITNLNDPKFRVGWAMWQWGKTNSLIDTDLRKLLLRKIAKYPRYAAQLYITADNLTVPERNLLLRSFHSKVRADKKCLYPQIEKELREKIVMPKFRRRMK